MGWQETPSDETLCATRSDMTRALDAYQSPHISRAFDFAQTTPLHAARVRAPPCPEQPMTDDLELPKPATALGARHSARTGSYFGYGFLGERLLDSYIDAVRWRLGLAAEKPAMPVEPPPTFSSAWGGIGGHVIVAKLLDDHVPERLWRRFERAARRDKYGDFYIGIEGVMPVLTLFDDARSGALAELAFHRVCQRLESALEACEQGRSIVLGLAHGLAGTLLSFEIGCALLAHDGSRLRSQTLALLRRLAVPERGGLIFRRESRGDENYHGICNGTPGVALALLLGARYSNDPEYLELVEGALTNVPSRGGSNGFCCGLLGRIEVLIEAYRVTDDGALLKLAKNLFDTIDPLRFADRSWQRGLVGLRFTQLRLEAPDEVDLPGLPLVITSGRERTAAI